MKLSEMRTRLAERGIQLSKSLGQNFLHDAHQLNRIVAAAGLTPDDKVLEIGPGLGPLTELLLARAGEVLAIEKDGRLVEVLRERFGSTLTHTPDHSINPSPHPMGSGGAENESEVGPAQASTAQFHPGTADGKARAGGREDVHRNCELRTPKFELLHDDALEFIQREARDWTDWKLVANLPYSVASPILVELAQSPQRPARMVVTLQLEVAQRLMAQAGEDDYGVLTLLVQLHYEPRGWFKIPATCFFPSPDVDSACVTLVRRETPLLAQEQRPAFVKIVKRAFSQRRKMMLKLLKQDWPADILEQAWAELKVPLRERAEKLSLIQFAALTRKLMQSRE